MRVFKWGVKFLGVAGLLLGIQDTFINVSYAGSIVGNGGDGVVCRESDGKIK